jgi:hypothetical protein
MKQEWIDYIDKCDKYIKAYQKWLIDLKKKVKKMPDAGAFVDAGPGSNPPPPPPPPPPHGN